MNHPAVSRLRTDRAYSHGPRRTAALLRICLTGFLAIWGRPALAQTDQPAQPEHQTRDFAPGVRIDWQRRLVEVDAEVVLREGELELLACSRHTHEHESILSVHARPLHIFQAMGLVGLDPGSPVRFDEKHDRWLPPTGEAVSLQVRYRGKGKEHVVPAEEWLLDLERRRPPQKLNWVFAGSRTFRDGKFGADTDGTFICVVNFETALITVGEVHSADDELLWLTANTDAIPPVGTACTLLIRSVSGKTLEVELANDGTLRCEGEVVSVADLARIFARDPRGLKPAGRVVLRASARVPERIIESVIASLARAGVDRAFIELRRSEPGPAHVGPQADKGDG